MKLKGVDSRANCLSSDYADAVFGYTKVNAKNMEAKERSHNIVYRGCRDWDPLACFFVALNVMRRYS